MNETELIKALIDAGLFKVLGVFITTPFGILIIIEVVKHFGYKKDKENKKIEDEDFKCKFIAQDMERLREYACRFSLERERYLGEIRDDVKLNGESTEQILRHLDIMVTDLREDRKVMIELIKMIYERDRKTIGA